MARRAVWTPGQWGKQGLSLLSPLPLLGRLSAVTYHPELATGWPGASVAWGPPQHHTHGEMPMEPVWGAIPGRGGHLGW